jgi:predicted  nucleic acid-binding Zn-ribbon protein
MCVCRRNDDSKSEAGNLRQELEQARTFADKIKEDLTQARSELTTVKDVASKHTERISQLEQALEDAKLQAASARNDLIQRDQQVEQEKKRAAAADSECSKLRSRLAALEDSLRAVSFREEQITKDRDVLLSKDADRSKVIMPLLCLCSLSWHEHTCTRIHVDFRR